MKIYYRLLVIFTFLLLQVGCGHSPNKETSIDEFTVEVSDSSQLAIPTIEEKPLSNFDLLQGKWQSIGDSTNYLIFEGNHRKEIAGGMQEWVESEFIFSDRCANKSDKMKGIKPEEDSFISDLEDDLCWYILYLSEDNLSLSYMARGNTLDYRRVE